MSAAGVVKALGGHRAGRDWMARCPAHNDREPSLAIREGRDGRVLLKCHAGCSQFQVIGALRDRGIWTPGVASGSTRQVVTPVAQPVEEPGDNLKRSAQTLWLWDECVGARGTLAEVYLRSRGLSLPVPDDIRFHPGLKHRSGTIWPAMVALVRDGDGQGVAIHRTFLAKDGLSKAPVSPAKMMLGPTRGGAVRLGAASTTLAIGEGIETTLSVMQSTGMPGWAALSTSGMKSLVLPASIREVVVLADADQPGEIAAQEAALRWSREGCRVRIARPQAGCKDFNDMLRPAPASNSGSPT
jgi:putative DNA primase/helicase